MARSFGQRGLQWPLLVFALLGASVAAHAYFVYASVSDPSAVVERDYYRKAVAWDAQREQEARNAALGWRLTPTVGASATGVELVVSLRDSAGMALTGARVAVEAFHRARAADVLHAVLEPRGDDYVAQLPARRAGLWELRFEVTRATERFTAVVERELAGGAEVSAP